MRARTGHELLLRPPEQRFSDGSQSIEVYLDGKLLGAFEFWWDDDQNPDDGLSDLGEALSVYLDEELRIEDW